MQSLGMENVHLSEACLNLAQTTDCDPKYLCDSCVHSFACVSSPQQNKPQSPGRPFQGVFDFSARDMLFRSVVSESIAPHWCCTLKQRFSGHRFFRALTIVQKREVRVRHRRVCSKMCEDNMRGLTDPGGGAPPPGGSQTPQTPTR